MATKILFALAVFIVAAQSSPLQSPLVLLDLSPEEAQKYLQSPPLQAPVLSARTASLPLVKYNDPRFRSSESGPRLGHYWKNGVEIDNTEDYVEDVYEASQYHGQDGLGAAAFGYSAPESSRVENIQSSGNVQGSYSYKDPLNRLIEVKYWSDGEGFHQEDNLPKVELQPVQETPEVREARLAHERAWQEAAALAKANPDPSGEYDPSRYEVAEASEPRQVYNNPQSNQQQQYQRQQQQYQQPQQQYQQQGQYKKQEDEENYGPPRGFFYSFTYPVSILVPKSQAGQGFAPGQVVDDDTIAVGAQPNTRYRGGENRPVQIHDAQVPHYRNALN